MKKSSTPAGRSTASRERSPGMISVIGIIGIVISMLLALIVILMPSKAPSASKVNVVFAGHYSNFPEMSMRNTIHAAGFEMQVSGASLDIDSDEQYVIVGIGSGSFDYVSQYRDNPSVIGFVLVCPEFPDGTKVSGMNGLEPSQDIAIFAGRDDAEKVSDIGDARKIYERLSGDDTVYGTPSRRGGLFGSTCYFNNYQNRWLSLGYFEVDKAEQLLFSPIFQNELAGYLSVSYGTSENASFFRINSWFVYGVMAIFLALVSFCIYLAGVPVITSEGGKTTGYSVVIFLILSMFITGGITAGCFIPKISSASLELLPFEGVTVLCAAMLVGGFTLFILNKSWGKQKSQIKRLGLRNTILRTLILAGAPVVLMTEFGFAFCDLSTNNLPVILAITFVDIMAYTVLTSVGGHYQAVSVLIASLSAVLIIVIGTVFDRTAIVSGAAVSLALVLVPSIVSMPSARHGNNSLITGVIHGLSALIIMLALI